MPGYHINSEACRRQGFHFRQVYAALRFSRDKNKAGILDVYWDCGFLGVKDGIMEVYPEPGHNEYECDEQAENEGLIEVLEYGLREDATNCYEEDLMPFVVRFDNADHAKAYVKKCIGSSDYTIQRDPAGRPIYTLPNNDNQMFYRRGNILLETLGDYDHREYEILKRELLKLSQW